MDAENFDADQEQDIFFEIEIDDNLPVSANELNEFNEYEMFELEVPEDLTLSDLSELEKMEMSETLAINSLPEIEFVDESSIIVSTSVLNLGGSIFVCSKCSRSYRRKHYFEKHSDTCGM